MRRRFSFKVLLAQSYEARLFLKASLAQSYADRLSQRCYSLGKTQYPLAQTEYPLAQTQYPLAQTQYPLAPFHVTNAYSVPSRADSVPSHADSVHSRADSVPSRADSIPSRADSVPSRADSNHFAISIHFRPLRRLIVETDRAVVSAMPVVVTEPPVAVGVADKDKRDAAITCAVDPTPLDGSQWPILAASSVSTSSVSSRQLVDVPKWTTAVRRSPAKQDKSRIQSSTALTIFNKI